jgi:L-rhamnose mutarotase
MKRFGMVIEVTEGKLQEYEELHQAVWPEVLERISASNIQNFSIYAQQMPNGKNYLFSYYEYVGSDYEKDMAAMAADKTTQEFWELCRPCQVPFPECPAGEWWTVMKEVFHHN